LSSEQEEICLWNCVDSLFCSLCSQCPYSVCHTLLRTIMDVRSVRSDDGLNAQSARLPEQAEAVSQDVYTTFQISLQCFILLPPGGVEAQHMYNLHVKRKGPPR
jgi:hypothetical protein